MERASVFTSPEISSAAMRVPAFRDLGLVELKAPSGLVLQLTAAGGLFAARHETTLINQLLASPGEDGLFRLLVREREAGGAGTSTALVGAGIEFEPGPPGWARWRRRTASGLDCTATLTLHTGAAAWSWCVEIVNTTERRLAIDVVAAQDLGLADEGAVRNNEAYTCQYIDLHPVHDADLGWVVLARQNQPATGGRHPWLAFACEQGAAAYATDGWQFFGADHRRAGVPVTGRGVELPSRKLQYECAFAALQSRERVLEGGARTTVRFVARFLPDHPAASATADLACVREVLGASGWPEPPAARGPWRRTAASLFSTAPWLHGDSARPEDWTRWFPGARRHEERQGATLLSFFHGADTHVVAREKEEQVWRPHGHILRSGDCTWIDEKQFGVTCYAAGVFGAQVYLGNPSFARLLPVQRNALGVTRAGGQRVFMRVDGAWRQLGIPSAFATTPGDVRWIYRLGEDRVEVRAWCSTERAAAFLEIRVVAGAPREFLVSHELVLGATEYEHGGEVTFHQDAGWAACVPDRASLVGRHEPGLCFAIAGSGIGDLQAIGGDEWLYPDRHRRSGAFVVLATRPTSQWGIVLLGGRGGVAELPGAVAAARAELGDEARPGRPRALVAHMRHPREPAVSRIDDILPWFNHNAAIHFSAPHGLEQYGGAAWGVRDVTQGSIEWLLAHGRHAIARRVLDAVFAQQYVHDGSWPQWFMHDPYRFIQQVHSHGDVCLWPVKALCDYVEAAHDLEIMGRRVGYTDAATFSRARELETYWEHCDRVVDHVVGRFVPGTALVNYGDGDWDDTLQPADPAMRTRMVSAWTVALAYQTFCQLADVARRSGEMKRADRLESLAGSMARDFREHLMPGGIVAGFLVTEAGGSRPLLHPDDHVTGIRYRLLPMTRAIIAGLFSPEEARRHLAIIERELRSPDGVRLMSDPVTYRGGIEHWFKRADTAANVGREIGLQYVHAHLRYAEALARVGDAGGLWRALQVVNPVGLEASVPNAALRQSNVYFSSSDADFGDRYEARARWGELRLGHVPVRGGWRLYSSGPGLFIHKVRACLLGVRESYDGVVFDPVLPRELDGLVATLLICGRRTEVSYRVRDGGARPAAIRVNGSVVDAQREANPYRRGGLKVPASRLAALLAEGDNSLEIDL